MKRARRALAALLAASVAGGCATTPKATVGVTGRIVSVVMQSEEPRVEGELLLVDKDTLWVRAEKGVREIPLARVREVQVKRHGLGLSKALTWVATGAVVSGVGMGAACGSVEDDGCAKTGLAVAGLWLLITTPAALSLVGSSRIEYAHPRADTLRPYARLPQGAPPGLAPTMLAGPPASPSTRKD